MPHTVSFIATDALYRELKAKSLEEGRTMSWMINEGLKGFLTGKKVSQADLIILELEQKAGKIEAVAKIKELREDLKHYAYDPTVNVVPKRSHEYRVVYMKNLENETVRGKLQGEIETLRNKYRLPGRPFKS